MRTHSYRTTWHRSLSLLLLLIGISFSTQLQARNSNSSASGAIDAKTFEALSKAQELTEKGKFNEALQQLDGVKDSSKVKGNSYAKSQMWNFYAYIYASQEKYRAAIDAYKKILAEADAPEGLKLQAKYTIAQMYFQIEDYTAVIDFMEQWLKTVAKPTSTARIMLAQAYYEKKNFDKALDNLNAGIELSKAEGKLQIDENWLRMKAAIYYEKSDIKQTLASYEELFQLYPKIDYLKQIAGLYGEVGDNRKRLTTYDAVFLHGALKSEAEILNLAYMYLGQGLPYQAGLIIENGIKAGSIKQTPANLETLANAWAQANEHRKAIPALERSAKASDKGLLYARLAGVYFDAGEFVQAAEAARRADEKGGLGQRGANQMLLGMALFNSKKFEEALQAFRSAKESKRNFRDAGKWEKYTLSELERLRQLQQSKLQLLEETEKAMQEEHNSVDAFGKNIIQNPESAK